MASRKSTACCCCSSNANSPGQRRVLHNPSSKHLIPLLKQLMARMYMEKEIDAVLPDCVESESDPTYYLCIQCFRALEKLIKARKDVEKLEEELAMKLEKVGVQCNLTRRVVQVDPTASHIPTNSQSNTPVKRLSSGSRPLEGRQSMETPVRDAVANVIAPTTPVVAVSCSFANLNMFFYFNFFLILCLIGIGKTSEEIQDSTLVQITEDIWPLCWTKESKCYCSPSH